MPETLEERVERLEQKIAQMTSASPSSTRPKNPWRTFGAFQNDQDFEEAVRRGREYREQQTYEREIAGS
jgi:hypothetical protein